MHSRSALKDTSHLKLLLIKEVAMFRRPMLNWKKRKSTFSIYLRSSWSNWSTIGLHRLRAEMQVMGWPLGRLRGRYSPWVAKSCHRVAKRTQTLSSSWVRDKIHASRFQLSSATWRRLKEAYWSKIKMESWKGCVRPPHLFWPRRAVSS